MILLVENDQDVRDVVRDLLSEAGYVPVAASHGQEALDVLAAATTLPSVILLDLTMPVMDGWEFLAIKARDPRIASIPVIVTSGAAERDLGDAATGYAEVLRKPMSLRALLAAVGRFTTG